MSDIEKLALLAARADEILKLADEVQMLRVEVARLRQCEHRALTSKEAAEVLRVSPATIVNWVHQGKIPAITSRNGYRIPSDKLFAIAEKEFERRAGVASARELNPLKTDGLCDSM